MKKLLFLLPVLVLLGCPPFEDTFKVYYNGPGTTGKVPVDSKAYIEGELVTVKGQGTLKKRVPGDSEGYYNFLGWRQLDHPYTSFKPGDEITIGWEDINLFAVWDDDSWLNFEVKDGEITITGLKDESNTFSRTVVIPDSLQGKNVTVLDDTAFSNLSITEVTLPKHLKRIGVGAFAGNNITGITISDTVEYIGSGAFRDNSLTKVTFGTGLTALESQTFYNNKLINIALPENIKTVKTGAFAKNDIIFIALGPNVDIQGDAAFGKYGDEFREFYNTKGKPAGLYQYNDTAGTWE
jgi:hypothetical protein